MVYQILNSCQTNHRLYGYQLKHLPQLYGKTHRLYGYQLKHLPQLYVKAQTFLNEIYVVPIKHTVIVPKTKNI